MGQSAGAAEEIVAEIHFAIAVEAGVQAIFDILDEYSVALHDKQLTALLPKTGISYLPQHLLYFFPLPHGQESFLPIFFFMANSWGDLREENSRKISSYRA